MGNTLANIWGSATKNEEVNKKLEYGLFHKSEGFILSLIIGAKDYKIITSATVQNTEATPMMAELRFLNSDLKSEFTRIYQPSHCFIKIILEAYKVTPPVTWGDYSRVLCIKDEYNNKKMIVLDEGLQVEILEKLEKIYRYTR